MANFDIILYIIAQRTLFHLCKIGQALYSDLLQRRLGTLRCWLMLSYTDAGRRPYDI